MPRYFIEVAYKGAGYSGFQVQQNANSIQSEIERAMKIYYRKDIELTGSSRTDAGVHALQNFFHFDTGEVITDASYHLNAILPAGIVVKRIIAVADDAHCRFDATSREYGYYIYDHKDPFLEDRAYFYPYALNMEQLNEAAALLTEYRDFTSFSKRNTQVHSFDCHIMRSEWTREGYTLCYRVQGNRFLRGMVRGLVGTMLHVGRGKTNLEQFRAIIEAKDCSKADFSVPPHGLFLEKVIYPFL